MGILWIPPPIEEEMMKGSSKPMPVPKGGHPGPRPINAPAPKPQPAPVNKGGRPKGGKQY